jgi:hypothetical protein
VIDEDLPLPLRLVPLHGDVVGVGRGQVLAHLTNETPHPRVTVNRVEGYIDVEPPGSGQLGISDQTQLAERQFEKLGPGSDLVPGRAFRWIEIKDRVGGLVEVAGR